MEPKGVLNSWRPVNNRIAFVLADNSVFIRITLLQFGKRKGVPHHRRGPQQPRRNREFHRHVVHVDRSRKNECLHDVERTVNIERLLNAVGHTFLLRPTVSFDEGIPKGNPNPVASREAKSLTSVGWRCEGIQVTQEGAG